MSTESASVDRVTCTASPSLALTKYWGKRGGGVNIPATSSLAVTLGALTTKTQIRFADGADQLLIDGRPQPEDRFRPVLDALRAETGRSEHFLAESENDFPTAAGLASSSSGVAALVCGAGALLGVELPPWKLSRIARLGSGSAARAVFGGFTVFPAGGTEARELYPPEHWPELRVAAVVLETNEKPMSSREAMERVRRSSPYFDSWIADAEELFDEAREAVAARDIERLGEVSRLSYLRMFATMFSANPPVLYWRPAGLEIIHTAEALRRDGIPVYETMDAGPQVKLITTEEHVEAVRAAVEDRARRVIVSEVGPAPQLETGGLSV